jgi:hypothetical protein
MNNIKKKDNKFIYTKTSIFFVVLDIIIFIRINYINISSSYRIISTPYFFNIFKQLG